MTNDRPPLAAHPGFLLAAMLRARGVSVGNAAESVGMVEPELTEVIKGKRDVTDQLAVRLADLTHTMPELWAGAQVEFDRWRRAKDDLDESQSPTSS